MNSATLMRAFDQRCEQEVRAHDLWRRAAYDTPEEATLHQEWFMAYCRMRRYVERFRRLAYRDQWNRKQDAETLLTMRRDALDGAVAKLMKPPYTLAACEKKCGGEGYSEARIRRALEVAFRAVLDGLVEDADDYATDRRSQLASAFEEAVERTTQSGEYWLDRYGKELRQKIRQEQDEAWVARHGSPVAAPVAR